MHTLEQIQLAALHYADAREALAGHVRILHDTIAEAEARLLPHLKKAVSRCAERQQHLRDLLNENPQLFDKPKSQIFHGIKVGYAKQPGGIEIEDPDHTVALIEKIYASRKALLDLLIITTKKPSKDGIADLPVDEAKKIGVKITDSGNAPFIRPVDGAVEKAVKALLKNALQETEEA